MNSRERFAAIMAHRQPDRVPLDIGATYPMTGVRSQRELAEFLGLPGKPRPVGAWGFDERIMEWAETDFRGVGRIVNLPSPHTKTISATKYVDCWGIQNHGTAIRLRARRTNIAANINSCRTRRVNRG